MVLLKYLYITILLYNEIIQFLLIFFIKNGDMQLFEVQSICRWTDPNFVSTSDIFHESVKSWL